MTGACHCGETEDIRLFACGLRCTQHTPSAIAGHPEPGRTRYCAPYRCYCGDRACPAGGSWARPLEPAAPTVVDIRAIASGKRRSSMAEYRSAQLNDRDPAA